MIDIMIRPYSLVPIPGVFYSILLGSWVLSSLGFLHRVYDSKFEGEVYHIL